MVRTPASEGSPSDLPGVSYVMPVLNDVAHVSAAVESILAQDYQGPFDVTIAVGPSIDGTNELVAELGRRDGRIRVIENPVGSTPAGLNVAIRASRHPIVIRVDAHSHLPTNYARIAVQTMLLTGADNVGGVMDAQGVTPFERAVARAYGTRVGLGGTRLHLGGSAGPAETVYLGVFRREAIERIGLFDEEIKRGQDWELNQRLRRAGSVVWFTPELSVIYRPRPSLRRLARQMFATGLWRADLTKHNSSGNSLRYFVPPAMVLSLIAGTVLGIVGIVLAALGLTPWLLLGFAAPAVYALFIAGAGLTSGSGLGFRSGLWFLVVLPCIHVAWGLGFVLGFTLLNPQITARPGRWQWCPSRPQWRNFAR